MNGISGRTKPRKRPTMIITAPRLLEEALDLVAAAPR